MIGLGYVGLPLAVEFGKKYPVVGFDVNIERVDALKTGHDATLEVANDDLRKARFLTLTTDVDALSNYNVFIVTVPTPVDGHNRPDLEPLLKASETVGGALKEGDIVIYESTVYPGATELDCVPVLEQTSGLTFNKDFFCGYSPERINPGDKTHTLTQITKVTSGSTPEAADVIDSLYGSIISAGTYKAESIQVAEAAKVIENTQRDLNIALMNELSILFDKLGLDTNEVLAAARTKWNFLPFTPGLVGGHCIGVDPYYLTHRAQQVGYIPEVILAGRRINDGMSSHVANKVAQLMMRRGLPVVGSSVLVMGLTFKENCPDMRNSKVVDLVAELQQFNAQVDVYDPWVDRVEVRGQHQINLLDTSPEPGSYDAMIVAVGHEDFVEMGSSTIRGFGKPKAVLFDLKGLFRKQESDGRL